MCGFQQSPQPLEIHDSWSQWRGSVASETKMFEEFPEQPRWNFKKANWKSYVARTNYGYILFTPLKEPNWWNEDRQIVEFSKAKPDKGKDLRLFTVEKVQNALKKMKNGTAARIDGIYTNIFRLSLSFSYIFVNRKFPRCFKSPACITSPPMNTEGTVRSPCYHSQFETARKTNPKPNGFTF